MENNRMYDTAIIGAGISGLCAGIFIAKAGGRVIIFEKNRRPGGYCASVDCGGSRYSLGLSSLGNYAKGSLLQTIFDEAGIDGAFETMTCDPAQTVVTPRGEFRIGSDVRLLKEEILSRFPRERDAVETFADHLTERQTRHFCERLRCVTYGEFLSSITADPELRRLLGAFLGALGVPARSVSALAALIVFREFIVKGTSFLKDDTADRIPELLLEAYTRAGGEILLGEPVKELVARGGRVAAVCSERTEIEALDVVATCDPLHLYGELLHDQSQVRKARELRRSGSAVVLYGSAPRGAFDRFLGPNIWLSFDPLGIDAVPSPWDAERAVFTESIFIGLQSRYNALLGSAGCDAFFVIVNTAGDDDGFNADVIGSIRSRVIGVIDRRLGIGPVAISDDAFVGPSELSRMTNSDRATIRGWASTVEQNLRTTFPSSTALANLHCAGQWVTNDYVQGGIVMAAANARQVARGLIRSRVLSGALR